MLTLKKHTLRFQELDTHAWFFKQHTTTLFHKCLQFLLKILRAPSGSTQIEIATCTKLNFFNNS